jgi:hypothetical protein
MLDTFTKGWVLYPLLLWQFIIMIDRHVGMSMIGSRNFNIYNLHAKFRQTVPAGLKGWAFNGLPSKTLKAIDIF